MPLINNIADQNPDLCCPITLELIEDPVVANDGHTYERHAIEALMQQAAAKNEKALSPMTRQELTQLSPNVLVKKLVTSLKEKLNICSNDKFWAAIKSGDVVELEKLNYTPSQLELMIKYNEADTAVEITPLLWCSRNGYTELLSCLLLNQTNINFKDSDGWTATMWAASKGHTACLKQLIEAKADINLKNNDGWTAVMTAAFKGHTECLDLLIKAKADLNTVGGTAAMEAASYGHTKCLKLLIDAKADVNLKNNDGLTAAMFAAFYGQLECLKLLIKAKADINLKDKEGQTAAMLAASEGHTECLKLLIEAKADINVSLINNNRWNAAMLAASKGYTECLKLLIEAKAEVGTRTAFHAIANKNEDCIYWLLMAGVKLAASDKAVATPQLQTKIQKWEAEYEALSTTSAFNWLINEQKLKTLQEQQAKQQAEISALLDAQSRQQDYIKLLETQINKLIEAKTGSDLSSDNQATTSVTQSTSISLGLFEHGYNLNP